MKYRFLYILMLILASNAIFARDLKDDPRTRTDLFERAPEWDVAKALYGTVPGLVVSQGTGSSASNFSELRFHGHRPVVLVDGIVRDITDVTASEIESISILDDAVSSALYGLKGGNGVVLIKTRRGVESKLKVTANYHFGFRTMFRAPEFADSYLYATSLNEALKMDGYAPRYSQMELDAFKNGDYPEFYPNVDWMSETCKDISSNHRLELTFTGGSKRFRYYSVVDYMYDDSFYKKSRSDKRYDPTQYNTVLGLRANIDVDITSSTLLKVGTMARLSQDNKPNCNEIFTAIYDIPSAAFPVRNEDNSYGGTIIYGPKNPVAMLNDTGAKTRSKTLVLADLMLSQDFSALVPGLSADVSVAFDYFGTATDTSIKEYKYSDMRPKLLDDGTVVSNQLWYGKDSQVLSHDKWVQDFLMRAEFQGRINYDLNVGKNHFDAHALYRQRTFTLRKRNTSSKTQEALLKASYNYGERYSIDLVTNWAGSSYLKKGERFSFYPAVNIAWNAKNEEFLKESRAVTRFKIFASAGKSGYDGHLEHELHLHKYGNENAGEYFFTHDATAAWGQAEGNLPVEHLTPETSLQMKAGADLSFLDNRLSLWGQFFAENRSNILITPKNVSGTIGIGINKQNVGEEKFMGSDFSISWEDKGRNWNYGIYANGTYLYSEVVNDGQPYQRYDYLYHKGNRTDQAYGLEAIGIFQNQYEINNSPKQTFGDVRPGDLKYRDQNNDGVINDEDIVKMFTSRELPQFYFGFGLHFGFKDFELSADFQGCTGITANLLGSPLYQPLVNNGNISSTFLENEVPWTYERAAEATMPRLTTVGNKNNYRNSSFWYRDASFLKLRNVTLSYTFSRKLLKVMDMKLYASGLDLFSLDNIKFADPELIGGGYPSTRSFWFGIKFIF